MLRHLDAAHNLARWLVRDPSTAEDVVQDAMLRAWRYFPALLSGQEKAWLLRIVRNVAYDYFDCQRRRGSEVSLNAADNETSLEVTLIDPRGGPEARAMRTQQLASLADAVEDLPMRLRECLILREVEALSYQEIAEIANVPIGTIMSRLARARRLLRGAAAAPTVSHPPSQSAGSNHAAAPR